MTKCSIYNIEYVIFVLTLSLLSITMTDLESVHVDTKVVKTWLAKASV